MRIRAKFLSTAAVLVALCSSQAVAQVLISVGNATAEQGGVATFQVSLGGVTAGGTPANSAQLDIIFASNTFDVTAADVADTTPAAERVCTVDPRLNVTATVSLPTAPNPGAGNQRLRLFVIDTAPPLGEVSDGVLFTCKFRVKADAPAGDAALNGTRVNVADTTGGVILASGETGAVDGVVSVEGGAVVCPDPTPVATPESGVFITIGDVTEAAPGGTANFSVSLNGVTAGGTPANSAQVDIIFPSATFDVTAADVADTTPAAERVCTVDPRLNVTATVSLPATPNPGEGNQRLRLFVIDTAPPLGEVSDGILFNCKFRVKADAPVGEVVLNGTRVNVADTTGGVILASGESGAVDGIVVVCSGGPAPATATPTSTPTSTEVPPTVTPTNTAQPTSTPTTVPPTRTPTRGSTGGIEDEDGCQMTTTSSSSAWALLVPVMMAFALRRRSN